MVTVGSAVATGVAAVRLANAGMATVASSCPAVAADPAYDLHSRPVVHRALQWRAGIENWIVNGVAHYRRQHHAVSRQYRAVRQATLLRQPVHVHWRMRPLGCPVASRFELQAALLALP